MPKITKAKLTTKQGVLYGFFQKKKKTRFVYYKSISFCKAYFQFHKIFNLATVALHLTEESQSHLLVNVPFYNANREHEAVVIHSITSASANTSKLQYSHLAG